MSVHEQGPCDLKKQLATWRHHSTSSRAYHTSSPDKPSAAYAVEDKPPCSRSLSRKTLRPCHPWVDTITRANCSKIISFRRSKGRLRASSKKIRRCLRIRRPTWRERISPFVRKKLQKFSAIARVDRQPCPSQVKPKNPVEYETEALKVIRVHAGLKESWYLVHGISIWDDKG